MQVKVVRPLGRETVEGSCLPPPTFLHSGARVQPCSCERAPGAQFQKKVASTAEALSSGSPRMHHTHLPSHLEGCRSVNRIFDGFRELKATLSSSSSSLLTLVPGQVTVIGENEAGQTEMCPETGPKCCNQYWSWKPRALGLLESGLSTSSTGLPATDSSL